MEKFNTNRDIEKDIKSNTIFYFKSRNFNSKKSNNPSVYRKINDCDNNIIQDNIIQNNIINFYRLARVKNNYSSSYGKQNKKRLFSSNEIFFCCLIAIILVIDIGGNSLLRSRTKQHPMYHSPSTILPK